MCLQQIWASSLVFGRVSMILLCLPSELRRTDVRFFPSYSVDDLFRLVFIPRYNTCVYVSRKTCYSLSRCSQPCLYLNRIEPTHLLPRYQLDHRGLRQLNRRLCCLFHFLCDDKFGDLSYGQRDHRMYICYEHVSRYILKQHRYFLNNHSSFDRKQSSLSGLSMSRTETSMGSNL